MIRKSATYDMKNPPGQVKYLLDMVKEVEKDMALERLRSPQPYPPVPTPQPTPENAATARLMASLRDANEEIAQLKSIVHAKEAHIEVLRKKIYG